MPNYKKKPKPRPLGGGAKVKRTPSPEKKDVGRKPTPYKVTPKKPSKKLVRGLSKALTPAQKKKLHKACAGPRKPKGCAKVYKHNKSM